MAKKIQTGKQQNQNAATQIKTTTGSSQPPSAAPPPTHSPPAATPAQVSHWKSQGGPGLRIKLPSVRGDAAPSLRANPCFAARELVIREPYRRGNSEGNSGGIQGEFALHLGEFAPGAVCQTIVFAVRELSLRVTESPFYNIREWERHLNATKAVPATFGLACAGVCRAMLSRTFPSVDVQLALALPCMDPGPDQRSTRSLELC